MDEELSRKFRSAENFGPVGPILSEKKGPCPEPEIYFICPRG